MKQINILAAVAAAVVLTVGCNKQQPTSGEPEGGTNTVSSTASNAWQQTKQASSNAWEATKGAATNAWQDAKETSSNAWEKTKDAFEGTNEVSTNYFSDDYSQKDRFVADARASLDQLDDHISSLSNKLASASDTAKANLQQQMQDLKAKRADLDQKYDSIKNATQDDWDNAKTAFESSYYSVKDSIKSAWHSLMNNS